MKDARRAKLRHFLELQAQWARRQMKAAGYLDQVGQRCAFQRHGEAAPEAREVYAMSVEAGHHADAREPAFRRLGLEEHRKAAAGTELQVLQQVHHALPARL